MKHEVNINTKEESLSEVIAKVSGLVEFLPEGLWTLEVKKQTRSSRQNRAIHLLFTQIADALNAEGQTFKYTGIKGIDLETQWTSALVKEMIWRPVMRAITGKESTTKMTTSEIDKVFVPINKAFGEMGIEVRFPDRYEL